jgi:hypothetical protein
MLRVHDADPARVERIRARCLAVLAERRRKEAARRQPPSVWQGWLEPALALGLSALYLAAAVGNAFALLR